MTAAQEDLAKGKMLISTGSGDVQAAMQIQASARERIFELQMALYEVDPDTYAAFATVGHNQTRAVFSSAAATASDSE